MTRGDDPEATLGTTGPHCNRIQELNTKLTETLGPGPASFGPALPADDWWREEEFRFSNEEQKAWTEIQEKLKTIKCAQEIPDRVIRQIAAYKQYDVDKTVKMIRKRVDVRQLTVCATELRQQLETCTLLPLPQGVTAKKNHVNDFFYMRPSRYHPSQTTAKAIITNLIYVMDSLHERRRQRSHESRIGFIANMNDWKMENFAVDYCKQFMFTLQGMKAPVHVDLFLIVNPPGWFDRIWSIMKGMLAPNFRKKVHMIAETQLADFLQPGFEEFLPNEFSTVGQADVPTLVRDFVVFREYYERVTQERQPSRRQAALLTPPRKVLQKQERERNRRAGGTRSDQGSSASDGACDNSSVISSSVGEECHLSGSDDIVSFQSGEDMASHTSSLGRSTDTTAESIRRAEQLFGPAIPPRVLEDAVSRLSPERSGTFFAIRERADKLKNIPYPFSDLQILRVAWLYGFDIDRTIHALKRIDARQLNITAEELQPQLAKFCLFPLPHGLSAKVNGVKDLFYMRPSRHFPSQTRCRTIITNLVYVMDTIYERHRDVHRKIGFIANMNDWTMENFSVSYCKQFMYTLQGKLTPMKVDLFLIVNPPGWFDRIWKIMKPMLATSFRSKVFMIPQDRLHEFLNEGFELHLPDEFKGIGKAHVPSMVDNFVAFRKHHERRTGARMPRAEQTALMLPPKRILKELERLRRLETKSNAMSGHDITQVEVTRGSSSASHLSGHSSDRDDDDEMDDLGEEDLNAEFNILHEDLTV